MQAYKMTILLKVRVQHNDDDDQVVDRWQVEIRPKTEAGSLS